MVRQIRISVPPEKASGVCDILTNQKIVHHLEAYHGETSTLIICKVVNKKTDEILQLLNRYSIGIRYGHIDVIALTSTKPRLPTFRGTAPKGKKYEVTDRMSYDEMVDFIDSQIHLTFDYLALIAVGALICSEGLLVNSPVNVVASMVCTLYCIQPTNVCFCIKHDISQLVSPLLGPIVGMTFGTIVRDKKMFWVSFRNECLGLFTCWCCGVAVGFLVGTFFNAESQDGPYGHNTEMSSRGSFTGLAWGAATAIPSGLGVALGVSSYIISALIGVAISAALLPPLCASFIMYLMPSQADKIVVHHWIKTGVISLGLFLCNWVLVYFSALIMFRIKNLHYHANAVTKGAKLAHFSKLLDDQSVTASTVDIGGSTDKGHGHILSTNIQSSSTVLKTPLLTDSFELPNVFEENMNSPNARKTSYRKKKKRSSANIIGCAINQSLSAETADRLKQSVGANNANTIYPKVDGGKSLKLRKGSK